MYEELIRRLREEPLDSNKAALTIMDLCIDAAAAIENLSHTLDMAQGERDAVTRHMIELEQEVCRLKSRLAAYEDTGLEPEEIKVHEAAKYNAGPDCDLKCLVDAYDEALGCDLCSKAKQFAYERPCTQELLKNLAKPYF